MGGKARYWDVPKISGKYYRKSAVNQRVQSKAKQAELDMLIIIGDGRLQGYYQSLLQSGIGGPFSKLESLHRAIVQTREFAKQNGILWGLPKRGKP